MYMVNPSNPHNDAFDENDDFRKSSKLRRTPGKVQ